MAREEQNTQQPTGGKGGGFHRKKQNIFKAEFPKQKGARGIIVHEKVKTMDEVGPSVASKKGKRGYEDCQRCRKKMKTEFRRFQQKEKKLKTLCEELGVTEEGLEAEFRRRLQQTEIKHNALCDKFGVAQEVLEIPSEDFFEMDDLSTSFNTEMFGSLFDGQSPTIGGEEALMNESPDQYKNESPWLQNIEEAAMNEHVNQDAMADGFIELDDLTSFNTVMFGSLFDGQSPTTGGEGAVMNKSPDQYKFGSFFDGQASVLGRKDAAMNEPPVQYKEIGSLGSKSHTIFNT